MDFKYYTPVIMVFLLTFILWQPVLGADTANSSQITTLQSKSNGTVTSYSPYKGDLDVQGQASLKGAGPAFAYLSFGPRAYISNAYNISVYDASKGTLVDVINIRGYGMAVHSPGTMLIWLDYSNWYKINMIDTLILAATHIPSTISMTGPNALGTRMAVAPDGSRVYIPEWDSDFLSVFDLGTKQFVKSINISGHSTHDAAVKPDGSKVYVTLSDAGGLAVVNTTTLTLEKTVYAGISPRNVVLNPAGTRAYVINEVPLVRVFDTTKDSLIDTIILGVPGVSRGLAISPDGSKLYAATASSGGNVSIINTATDTVTNNVKVGSQLANIAITPDGKLLYITDETGKVFVMNTATRNIDKTINGLINPFYIAIG